MIITYMSFLTNTYIYIPIPLQFAQGGLKNNINNDASSGLISGLLLTTPLEWNSSDV